MPPQPRLLLLPRSLYVRPLSSAKLHHHQTPVAVVAAAAAAAAARTFLTTSTSSSPSKNRIYDPIRTPNDLHTLTLLCAAQPIPLITLWTASFCRTCAAVKPLLRQLIEEEGVGEGGGREAVGEGGGGGGLAYAEVELDAPGIGGLGSTYAITSLPTLLAFSRQEAQSETKVTRPEELRNKEFLREWLVREAMRGGREGGGGGSGLGGMLGGLFKS